MKTYEFGDKSKPVILLLPGTCCHWENENPIDRAYMEDLFLSMPKAKAVKVKGGHTATLYKADEYVRQTREFLENLLQTGGLKRRRRAAIR